MFWIRRARIALNLLAWVRYRPSDPKVDELATDLFQRRVHGHWHTTQGNAWSLLALASYVRTAESGDPNSKGQVRLDEVRKRFSLTKANPSVTLNFAFSDLKAAPSFVLQKEAGTVFSELTVEARPKIVDRPEQDQGYSLNRRYARVSDDGKVSPAENLRVGDRVLITLDVEVRRRATYVAIEDPLPSVFEPINPAFKSQETLAGQRLGRDWISDYQEMRNDRVLFFADMLYPGHYTLRYLARVVAAGEATTPSAKVEEMYHPEQFGLTETGKIRTESLQ